MRTDELRQNASKFKRRDEEVFRDEVSDPKGGLLSSLSRTNPGRCENVFTAARLGKRSE